MAKEEWNDGYDAEATAGASAEQKQSARPRMNRSKTEPSAATNAQLNGTTQRSKKHVVGGGRIQAHSRVPSAKALNVQKQANPSAKVQKQELQQAKQHRRGLADSPSPEDPALRSAMMAATSSTKPTLPSAMSTSSSSHRRVVSDVKLARDSSTTNLKKNLSQTSLKGMKRIRSHVEVGRRTKSQTQMKRTSVHKETHKPKKDKGTVHFDLGNDDAAGDAAGDDEWVDASASASPFLSRRGSVIDSSQLSAKAAESEGVSSSRPPTSIKDGPSDEPDHAPDHEPDHDPDHDVNRRQGPQPQLPGGNQTHQHKEYLTSRVLKRNQSQGAIPQLSTEVAQVTPAPYTPSPRSGSSQRVPSAYRTASRTVSTSVGIGTGSSNEEVISRFVGGPPSGVTTEPGSLLSPTKSISALSHVVSDGQIVADGPQRDKCLSSFDNDYDEGDGEESSAFAPRVRRPEHRAPPADKSRTQQKLNLQRASSNLDPVQAQTKIGPAGASPLLGGRDPRIGKLLERTGAEYLVVRRYQNPIARSIARLEKIPGAGQTKPVATHNPANVPAAYHSDQTRQGPSTDLVEGQTSQAVKGRLSRSIGTNDVASVYEAGEEEALGPVSEGSTAREHMDEDLALLLRNLWEKNMDLSASQD